MIPRRVHFATCFATMSGAVAFTLAGSGAAQTLSGADQQHVTEAKLALAKYKDCAAAAAALDEVSPPSRRSALWMTVMGQTQACIGTPEALMRARRWYEQALAKRPDAQTKLLLADSNYKLRKARQAAGSRAEVAAAPPSPVAEPSPTATPLPSPTPCDTSNHFFPDDPAGHWTDGGPTNIVNKCECIARGIRIVGVKFGLVSQIAPAIWLQIFNTSGERRSIWADVKYAYGGWEQSRPVTLRADEREGFQVVKGHYGQDRITDINVLGCGS